MSEDESIYEFDNFDDEDSMDWWILDNDDYGKSLVETMVDDEY